MCLSIESKKDKRAAWRHFTYLNYGTKKVKFQIKSSKISPRIMWKNSITVCYFHPHCSTSRFAELGL